MTHLQARLAPWATERITKNYGKVTKTTIKQSFAEFPDTEMHAIATPFQQGGYFTTREVCPATIELRYNNDMGLAMIEVNARGKITIR
jgi:hypothetical protein